MSIDKMRVAAVQMLEARGFTFTREHGWSGPDMDGVIARPADITHGLLMARADALGGGLEGSDEE